MSHNFLFLPHDGFDIEKAGFKKQGSHILFISTEINMEAETVHHLSTEKTEEGRSEATKCNKKMLKFSLSIDDSELVALQKLSHPQPEQNEKDTEDDCFIDDNVLHWPANMSLNVIVDEDSDADNPLCNWEWQPNESQVMPKTTDIAYISSQIFRAIEVQKDLFLKSFKGHNYVASKHNKICLEKTMSAKITISHIENSDIKPDYAVALNFTGTDNFLCCTSQGEEKILTVKTNDTHNLKSSAKDPEKASFIFYMSENPNGQRNFESMLHRGWFIHTINDDVVKMKRGQTSTSCFVLE
ncbi:uncharacterized protein si:ch73-226l13.2 [Carassius gibelio]|uniref:uncharacterized protein si:ch73-226l13.2 n=1 Tax=Carassius gibelio TaxID=101364 RepID=UPI0022774306|nr:uncharacterized protein si:ch73-226l13.2 [Carassius gibelio]